MTGTVKKLYKRPRKGKPYAFIAGVEGDYYCNEVSGLEIGMIVSFEGERNEKGFVASNVRLLDE